MNSITNNTPFEPEIFITCDENGKDVEKYGKWVNANQSPAQLESEIEQFLFSRRKECMDEAGVTTVIYPEKWVITLGNDFDCIESYFSIFDGVGMYVEDSMLQYTYANGENFEDLNSRHQFLSSVSLSANILVAWGELGGRMINHHGNLDDARMSLEDMYCGEFDSEVAFAKNIFNTRFDSHNNLYPYIDFEKFARDLFLDYYSVELGGLSHIFHR
jgi:hypothetical protein